MPKIVTTNRKNFKPLGRRADYAWEVLCERLTRELGPDYATLLAEPITEAGVVDWHANFFDLAKLISELGADQSGVLSDRLQTMRMQVLALADRIEAPGQRGGDKGFADALRRAMVTPDDSRYAWAVDGKPVLVAWGMVYIGDERPEAIILGEGLLKRPYRVNGEPNAATAAMAPPPISPILSRSRWPAFLWLLFAALMGAIYFLLLQACGVLIAPEDSMLRRILPLACHAGAMARSNIDVIAQREELQRKIKKAELDLARLQGDCTPPQQPLPQRQAQVQPAPPAAPVIEKRLERERAATGELQISLAWNGLEDLDLHVRCPVGIVLNYASPRNPTSQKREACGGVLDIDMNNEASNVEAVENSVWASPPAGNYEVIVRFHSRKNQVERAVPFIIRIKRGDNVQTFNGTLARPEETILVHAFTL